MEIKVVGKVNNSLKNKLSELFSVNTNKNEVFLFCDYSLYEFPLDYFFTKINNSKDFAMQDCSCYLKKVTQQMFVPLDYIPVGWKTICLFDFHDGVPEIVESLPTIDDWYKSDKAIFLSDI